MGDGSTEPALIEALIDRMPAMVLVADRERRIRYVNRAASERFGVHALPGDRVPIEPPEDCPGPAPAGSTSGCQGFCGIGCILRDALLAVFGPDPVFEEQAGVVAGFDDRGRKEDRRVLVSTQALEFAGETLALIAVADARPVLRVGKFISICSASKRIRTEDGRWEEVEVFFRDRAGVEFSHTLSPESARELYGQFLDEKLGKRKGG